LALRFEKTKAHQKYRLRDGTLVPGVTTVLGMLGWNKHALIAWARKEALAERDPNIVRDKAADIGSLAHFLIHCHLRDEEPDLSEFSPEHIDKAENCFLAFLEWADGHKLRPLETEIQLVSERYGFGGTIDLVAEIDGRLSIIDFKSSNGIYPEMIIQVAAYCQLYKENKGSLPVAHLLRLGKEDGSFEYHYYPELGLYWQVFLHCLEIYRLYQKIKKGG